MFLVDFQIAEMCEHPSLTWSPSHGEGVGQELPLEGAGPLIEPFSSQFLGPASYDLSVGSRFASPQALNAYIVRGAERSRTLAMQSPVEFDATDQLRPGEAVEVLLEPNQVLLCHSAEYVRIPPGAVGILALRSTYAREWLDHSAADFIQPGFQGTITYELRNNGPRPYSIRSGMRVMQIAFARTAAVPSKLYSGVYNGQQAELFARHQRGTP